ncbi:hypothetical protein PQC11_gp076 [Synechococcus phage S-H9-1]|uniref:Uncharacterized protein n=1 Tax=Synechococcus phage S-H9-1 TaxID=2783674 RepID=A0A873WH21_9CAUD|nr:hypothetical protein PQC11_gp076 [Synechococcus phage S-H9-1]QPB08252.1 hypothetical protein [Synechococcus phage S-H9-1]
MNVELSQEEYQHILELRRSKYYLDITDDEYETIRNTRELKKSHTDKYIENVQKIQREATSSYITRCATELLDRISKLKSEEITLSEFVTSSKFLTQFTEGSPEKMQAEALNHIITALAQVYPN